MIQCFLFQTTLGLLSEDFNVDSIFQDQEKRTTPRSPVYTDHDYVMQPAHSPSNSDSGVSIESSSLSPQYDNMSHTGSDINSMSGSPRSPSQFSPGIITNISSGDQLSCSSVSDEQMDPLGLENIDFGEMTNIDFDTIDADALVGTPDEDSFTDRNVSIDLGNDKFVCQFVFVYEI